MNVDQKLTAIRDLIQQDVGNRGLAKDPEKNLINAYPDDFANACVSIAEHPKPSLVVVTGFFIPTATPPAHETDGPLGALYIARVFDKLGIPLVTIAELRCVFAMHAGAFAAQLPTPSHLDLPRYEQGALFGLYFGERWSDNEYRATHRLAIERPGDAANGRRYTMRG